MLKGLESAIKQTFFTGNTLVEPQRKEYPRSDLSLMLAEKKVLSFRRLGAQLHTGILWEEFYPTDINPPKTKTREREI